jgi:hypothetical protein
MKRNCPVFLLALFFTVTACMPRATVDPAPPPATEPAPIAETQISTLGSSTELAQPSLQNQYTNSAFGLSFEFPSNWFGPEEYVSDQTLRVEVGSDVVYPYGEPPEQPSGVRNSYNIVIQFSGNDQNPYWNETYQSLANLQDGESLSGARGRIIRVRQLDLGRFKGFEYIATLSETAQTQPVYGREVILIDEENYVLTIFGNPNNVEVSTDADWRDVYRMIDEANLTIFRQIVESLKVE